MAKGCGRFFRSTLRAFERFSGVPLLSYTTDKEIRYHDTTLSILHKVLFTFATSYMLIEILFRHKYARFEAPIASVNTWTDFNVAYSTTGGLPPYCYNSAYDVSATPASGNFEAKNISCRSLPPGEVVEMGETTFVANTFLQVKFNGTVDNFFVTNVEDMPLNIQHSFATSFLTETNLNTKIYDFEGNAVLHSKNGDPILGLTVGQILRWAGVSLDSRIESAAAFGPELPPFRRLTGVVILVKLEYTNFREWDFADRSPHCRIRFVLQRGMWGYLGPSARHYSLTERALVETMGVRLIFVAEGQLGEFSFYDLLVSALSGSILVGFATAFVNYVGGSWLAPSKRRRFNLARTEHVILDTAMIEAVPSVSGLDGEITVGKDGVVRTVFGSTVSIVSHTGDGERFDEKGIGSNGLPAAETVVPVFDDDDDAEARIVHKANGAHGWDEGSTNAWNEGNANGWNEANANEWNDANTNGWNGGAYVSPVNGAPGGDKGEFVGELTVAVPQGQPHADASVEDSLSPLHAGAEARPARGGLLAPLRKNVVSPMVAEAETSSGPSVA